MNRPNTATQPAGSAGGEPSLREILDAIREQTRMLTTIGAHLAKLVTLAEKQGVR